MHYLREQMPEIEIVRSHHWPRKGCHVWPRATHKEHSEVRGANGSEVSLSELLRAAENCDTRQHTKKALSVQT